MPPASGCSTSARAPDHGHVAAGPPRREPRPGHPLRRRRGQEARAHPHLGHGWRAPRVGRGARGGDGAGGAGQTGRGDCGRVDAVWRLPVQQVCPVVPARRQVPKRALALVLLCNLLPAPDGGAQPAAPAHLLARLRSVHARARPAPRRLDAPADAARPPLRPRAIRREEETPGAVRHGCDGPRVRAPHVVRQARRRVLRPLGRRAPASRPVRAALRRTRRAGAAVRAAGAPRLLDGGGGAQAARR
mmetsp:Transcript_36208/g.119302  ORF Transcript_36208/g.119302 Transcript_36208/m.119302 type:complete len:246 (+) Transcript_36208:514-1251(+)